MPHGMRTRTRMSIRLAEHAAASCRALYLVHTWHKHTHIERHNQTPVFFSSRSSCAHLFFVLLLPCLAVCVSNVHLQLASRRGSRWSTFRWLSILRFVYAAVAFPHTHTRMGFGWARTGWATRASPRARVSCLRRRVGHVSFSAGGKRTTRLEGVREA